jgi:hypothetical protein
VPPNIGQIAPAKSEATGDSRAEFVILDLKNGALLEA